MDINWRKKTGHSSSQYILEGTSIRIIYSHCSAKWYINKGKNRIAENGMTILFKTVKEAKAYAEQHLL